jgi:hypothetical protein
MRLLSRVILLTLITMHTGAAAFAQAATNVHPAHPWKRYCQSDGGFCFKYPASWKMLGEIYEGQGVVVAPVQKEDQSFWDNITVAMVAPPAEGDDQGIGLNGVIEQAAAGMRDAGQDFRTLQRQERTVDAKPAEILKAQYRDKATGRDWIEELVFIQGPDNEIYSVALKTAPQNAVRLEPVFTEILKTWTLPEPEPPAVTDDSVPSQAPAEKPPADAPAPHL